MCIRDSFGGAFASFILGDLHPHVLALPFAFLAMAVALAWWLEITNYELRITNYEPATRHAQNPRRIIPKYLHQRPIRHQPLQLSQPLRPIISLSLIHISSSPRRNTAANTPMTTISPSATVTAAQREGAAGTGARARWLGMA